MNEFNKVIDKTTRNLDAFRFSQAAEDLYHYCWHTFADKIIEDSKDLLQDKNEVLRTTLLVEIMGDMMRLLHPFIPFITEKIYQNLPLRKNASAYG